MTDVHVDAILSNVSVAYMQDANRYLATRVFPVVSVDKKSDKYYTYTKADWMRDEAKPRADNTESAGSGYTVSADSYLCDVFAFHKDIGDQLRANADSVFALDAEATRFVTNRLLLRMERQWVTDYFGTSKWGLDLTGVSGVPSSNQFRHWSDYSNSDPIIDVEVGKRQIVSVTGYMPNTLVMGYDVFVKLQHHPDIVDRYKYTSSTVVTEDMLARLFGVDRILVSQAVYASSVEGETAAYAFTHGKHALLCYVAPNPNLMVASAGYTFLWRGISGAVGQPIAVRKFRMEPLKSDRVEGEAAWDNKIIGADLGVFFNTAVA
jgi:hypothetical protein